MRQKQIGVIDDFSKVLFSKLKKVESEQQEIVSLRLQLTNSIKAVEKDTSLNDYQKRHKVLEMKVKVAELNIQETKIIKERKAIEKDLELYDYSRKRTTYTSPEYRERYELVDLRKQIEQHTLDLDIIEFQKQKLEFERQLIILDNTIGTVSDSVLATKLDEIFESLERLEVEKKNIVRGYEERGYVITSGLNHEVRNYVERSIRLCIITKELTREESDQALSTLEDKDTLSEKDVVEALNIIQTKTDTKPKTKKRTR